MIKPFFLNASLYLFQCIHLIKKKNLIYRNVYKYENLKTMFGFKIISSFFLNDN